MGFALTRWSLSLLGEHVRSLQIDISDTSVGCILRGALLQPHRQKMWLNSQDDEFLVDNLSTHTTDEVMDWLEEHPRWSLHFIPKYASWLNQIECAFSDLQRHVLARGSFASKDGLHDKIFRLSLAAQ